MNGFLGSDSFLMQGLNFMANLVIVNLLTIICCIPIFTIGASLSGMHYIMLKLVRKEEGYIVRAFFHGFRENFRQATGEWMICLIILGILSADAYLIFYSKGSFPTWLTFAITALITLVFLLFQWVFPLQIHFVNTVRSTLKNAILVGLANFWRTLLMALVWLIPIFIFLVGSIRFLPILFIFGLSLPAWLMAKLYSPVFEKIEENMESSEKETEGIENVNEIQKRDKAEESYRN